MVMLGRRALRTAYGDQQAADGYTPDTALINFYDGQARLGMHQDKDERSSAPVVSLSVGDTCVFRVGNTQTRTKPYTDIELASGAVLARPDLTVGRTALRQPSTALGSPAVLAVGGHG